MAPRSREKATFKDVCYAMQFGHERLILTLRGGSSPIEYTMEPSRRLVEQREAERVLNSGHAIPIDHALIGNTPQSYGWRD